LFRGMPHDASTPYVETNMPPPLPIPEFLTTARAAEVLGRSPQTLRRWSSTGQGPVQPVRRFGRLAWPADRIREFLARGE
jgi:hypothetical protein